MPETKTNIDTKTHANFLGGSEVIDFRNARVSSGKSPLSALVTRPTKDAFGHFEELISRRTFSSTQRGKPDGKQDP